MSSVKWTSGVSGDWNTGTLWTPATVPGAADDVTIDAANTLYTVTIANGKTETVHSLSMNNSVGRPGTNDPAGYHAAELILEGTLAFAPGSAGALDGPLQTYVFTDFGSNAAIVNGGTLNAFIQVQGNLVMTGTNAVYITNEIQALSGTVTIDTPIATMTGTTLFDGIFQAKGRGAVMNLGGVGNTVNIVKMEGPQDNVTGWTELTFADASSQINEWNGTAYVSVESSLTEISGGSTVDVTFGRNFTSTNSLTIDHIGASVDAGMLNMEGVTVTTGGININSGIVQGYGTIASNVLNNGTMIALGGTANGTLDVTGNLTGTGVVLFDNNAQSGSADATKGTLMLHSVSAGQTVKMNSGDKLVLASPQAFAGTIQAAVGGSIVLDGVTATSAVVNNGTLVVKNGTTQVAALALSGTYTGEAFTANGSIISLGTAALLPTISGTVGGQMTSDLASITPFSHVTIADPNVGQTETVTVTPSVASHGAFKNLGAGTYKATTGVYTVTGSATAVTSALDALVFVPTRAEVPAGQSVTTSFTVSVTDTAAANATDATTSVVATSATAQPGEVILTGSSSQYAIANANGTLYVVDNVANRNGTQALPNTTVMSFSDGTGLFDPTGSAEDVARLYGAALHRAPDQSGVQYWAGQMDNGNVSLASVAESFASSPEFIQTYGSLTNDVFVQQLYQNVLNRPADSAGLQFWDGQLASGATRGAVVVGFSQGSENEANTISTAGDVNNAETYRLYVAALGRTPDASGLNFWSGQLANGQTPLQVAQGFTSSQEFQQDYGTLSAGDFVSALYQNILHRAGDSGGVQYWTNDLNQGASQASVVVGFADSTENRVQTAAATHANWVFIPA